MKSKSILVANLLATILVIFIPIFTAMYMNSEIDPSGLNTPSLNFWGVSTMFGLAFNVIVGWTTYVLKKSGGALICAIFSLYNIIVSLVVSLVLFGTAVIHYELIIFVPLYVIGFIVQRSYNEDDEF